MIRVMAGAWTQKNCVAPFDGVVMGLLERYDYPFEDPPKGKVRSLGRGEDMLRILIISIK